MHCCAWVDTKNKITKIARVSSFPLTQFDPFKLARRIVLHARATNRRAWKLRMISSALYCSLQDISRDDTENSPSRSFAGTPLMQQIWISSLLSRSYNRPVVNSATYTLKMSRCRWNNAVVVKNVLDWHYWWPDANSLELAYMYEVKGNWSQAARLYLQTTRLIAAINASVNAPSAARFFGVSGE